jgi:hypothetical protein
MPRIFDNIERQLLPALRETIEVSNRADFCVGYFNLRGWKELDSYIEKWSGGEGHCCRLLVGMQRLPGEELRTAMSLVKGDGGMDNQTAVRLKKTLAQEFRDLKAAIKIAAHHLNKRGGALIGDVVGLGKTVMAAAY